MSQINLGQIDKIHKPHNELFFIDFGVSTYNID